MIKEDGKKKHNYVQIKLTLCNNHKSTTSKPKPLSDVYEYNKKPFRMFSRQKKRKQLHS
jgi:hypothetical protein